jgi:hypothetical protein
MTVYVAARSPHLGIAGVAKVHLMKKKNPPLYHRQRDGAVTILDGG